MVVAWLDLGVQHRSVSFSQFPVCMQWTGIVQAMIDVKLQTPSAQNFQSNVTYPLAGISNRRMGAIYKQSTKFHSILIL
jgi:hypothetical protein